MSSGLLTTSTARCVVLRCGACRVYLDLPASLPPCLPKLPGALAAPLCAAGITSSGWPTNTGTTLGRARTMRRHPVGIWPGGVGGALLQAQGFRSSACQLQCSVQASRSDATHPSCCCSMRLQTCTERAPALSLATSHTSYRSVRCGFGCMPCLAAAIASLPASCRPPSLASKCTRIASWLKQHSALASMLSAGGAQRAQRRCTGCVAGAGTAQPVPPCQLRSSSCRLAAC